MQLDCRPQDRAHEMKRKIWVARTCAVFFSFLLCVCAYVRAYVCGFERCGRLASKLDDFVCGKDALCVELHCSQTESDGSNDLCVVVCWNFC